jgi:serine/threonine-protein kinase HipA
VKKLNVFYEEKRVGSLYRDSELVYSFSYSDEWLKDDKAFQLSLAMPLQEKPFGNKITLSFFENLLPEGEPKDALEKSQNTKGIYDFLKKFGKDCAGAIIVSEAADSPMDRLQKSEDAKVKMSEIYSAIDEKRSVAEVIANLNPGYLSIAGAQDKFAAIFREGSFFLPTRGRPTTHIIKVPIYHSGVKESVYNEYFCMRLAELVGLTVPKCFVVDHLDHPLYVTERYDRTLDREVRRIHQQDFCQAQGITSDQKYESKGGPSLQDNYQLIQRNVTVAKRSKAMFDFLDWICFNLFIGNNDTHSKNLSFLLVDGKVELAPFYDLICTAVYPKLDRNFAFRIGDRKDAGKIGKKQFEMVDKSLGLKQGTMSLRASEISERLQRYKDSLAIEIGAELPSAKIVKRIAEFIEKRRRSLKRQGLNI